VGPWVWQSIVGGAIGGATVLLGVLVAEWLTRVRERRDRINDSLFNVLQFSILLTVEDTTKVTPHMWIERVTPFQIEVGRLGRQARWPMRNAKEIRQEVHEILKRYKQTSSELLTHQKKIDPREVVGDRLGPLVRIRPRHHWWHRHPKSEHEDNGP
jgi:hypothetical protein